MTRQFIIRRMLAILMIAGLILAPVSRPSMAGTMSDVAMSDGAMSDVATSAMVPDMPAAAMTDEMASDMPCCPSKAPAPIGCDKCLFMAVCAAKCFSGLAASLFQPRFAVAVDLAYLRADFWLDGLGQSPPDHPPRILT